MEPKVSSTSISTSSLIRTPPSAAPSSSHYGEATPQPRCRTGQGSDRQQTRRVCEPTRAVRAAGRGRLTLAPPKARRAAAGRATSGTESRPVRHPRKPPTPQISRFCVRTLATTAAICRGQNGGSVSGYHELMTSLTAQRSATVRRTGSRAVFYTSPTASRTHYSAAWGAVL